MPTVLSQKSSIWKVWSLPLLVAAGPSLDPLLHGHSTIQRSVLTTNGCSTSQAKDYDRCPGGPPGYTEQEVAPGPTAAAECAALCCDDSACEVWVTRQLGAIGAGNCSAGSTCCWTKPFCSGTIQSPGTTSGTIYRPNKNFSFIDTATYLPTVYQYRYT